eukprot:jgi/Chlat1/7874/Chrsp66S07309
MSVRDRSAASKKGADGQQRQQQENGDVDVRLQRLRAEQQKLRDSLGLWRSPIVTLKYFALATWENLLAAYQYLTKHLWLLIPITLTIITCIVTYEAGGKREQALLTAYYYGRFVVYWVGLGVASSIGLGTGLHTFVLYLGPHIMRFTLKATQCGRVDLKSAPYDTAQWGSDASWQHRRCVEFGAPQYAHWGEEWDCFTIPVYHILRSVQLEAILWGLGTALGELPPYFVSRAARLSGERVKELDELEELSHQKKSGLFHRAQAFVAQHAQQFGWFTILLFASVPNPLFDLAGITCGHLLVPFWKFFSATMIGKAFVKVHIQALAMIVVFNATQLHRIQSFLDRFVPTLPYGELLLPKIDALIDSTKEKYTVPPELKDNLPAKRWTVASVWNYVVAAMLLGFVGSIVTSTARGYLAIRHKRELAAYAKQRDR